MTDNFELKVTPTIQKKYDIKTFAPGVKLGVVYNKLAHSPNRIHILIGTIQKKNRGPLSYVTNCHRVIDWPGPFGNSIDFFNAYIRDKKHSAYMMPCKRCGTEADFLRATQIAQKNQVARQVSERVKIDARNADKYITDLGAKIENGIIRDALSQYKDWVIRVNVLKPPDEPGPGWAVAGAIELTIEEFCKMALDLRI